jgi:OOP family OmpA-OmpF porin
MIRQALIFGLGLMAGLSTHAAQGRFYDPSNPASATGVTVGHELYRTIGCPGEQLLGRACPPEPVTAKPAPAALSATPVPAAPKDSDGDGVPDDMDRCPGTPAGARVDAQGCELDSDGDGVVDRLDRCPNTPAGARVDAQGCELDSDGDGVVDALDQCPNTPRGDQVDAKGCTLASTLQLKGVNFDNDSAALRADARPILDEAVTTLKRYPQLRVEVAGHTDDRGSDAYNLDLSQRRAQAVLDYFVQMGIDAARLVPKGYGETAPVADNATDAGRAKNRRVELRILP